MSDPGTPATVGSGASTPPIGSNKSVAAAGGSAVGVGVGGAVAGLIISGFWPHADPTTAANLTTVCNVVIGALSGGLAAYATPHGGNGK